MKVDIGDRVIVFDNTLYIDDVKTPLSKTMKKATVVKVHNKYKMPFVDVIFDHKPKKVSKGHFISGIKREDSNG